MTPKQKQDDFLTPLKKKYVTNLTEKKAQLESFVNLLQRKELPEAQREELALLAHSLSGSGATYGFPNVSERAAELEKILATEQAPIEIKTSLVSMIDTISEIIITDRSGDAAAAEDGEAKTESRKTLPLVLVADDDEMIRIMLNALLKDHARIIECGTATDALRLMKTDAPDLVLLDDKMPGELNGIELLEKIQHSPKIAAIPVMMVTGNSDSKKVLRGLMAGAVDYILKPIDPEQITSRVVDRLNHNSDIILVADDDVSIRNMLKHKLLRTGCRIMTAEDGNQAIDIIKEHKPALIILDRMMPGLDGVAVLNKMKGDPDLADIPVIFMSAKQKETDVLDGLDLGAVDYIVKPFNPDIVVARCTRILKAKQEKDGAFS